MGVLKNHVVRNDAQGGGHFESSRGARKHRATDYVVTEGEPIFMPEDGIVERRAYPYGNDRRWEGVKIKGYNGIDYKLFYFMPLPDVIGKTIKAGDVIGHAQAISNKYPSSSKPMKDHLHVEMYKNGERINPELHLNVVPKKKSTNYYCPTCRGLLSVEF